MTDEKHFDDLTQISCPFGMLDRSTRARLAAWSHGWERFSMGRWALSARPDWFPDTTYRARPAKKPVFPYWSVMSDEIVALAKDENQIIWAYESIPTPRGCEWRASTGEMWKVGPPLFCDLMRYFEGPWKSSLIVRPCHDKVNDG